MDRLRELNPPQRDAVTTLSGPLLVLAGAGTGKTRVITYRMVELMRSGTPGGRILSVTFTNKAAKEMRERLSALAGSRHKKLPHISTFHSLCVRILRQEIDALGYPKTFSICDRGDQESMARTALRDCRMDDKTMRPADLLNRISRWKMLGVASDEAASFVDNDLDNLAAVAFRRYQKTLRARGAVDFDDLLLLTIRLFEEFPEILDRQRRRFDHVQIDEYQDTNGVQFRLIRSLVDHHNSLCVVGDDDQSIYGWRGAEVEHILNFHRYFPAAKIVRLQDNYRCTNEIIDLANRLVRNNRGRYEKTLVAHKPGPESIRFREYPDELTEAESIAREIKFYIEQKGVAPHDFAILFRTNEQPRIFETELRRHDVRYNLVGGQSFFDRREIRDVLAYLKAIAFETDEVSLLRIINTPARGIGDSTVEKILQRAVRTGVPFWKATPAALEAKEITPKAARAIDAFESLIRRYRHKFKSAPQQMAEHVAELLEEIDYRREIEKQYKEALQLQMRMAMLEQVVEAVREYVRRAGKPTLADFLEETALTGRDEDFGEGEEKQQTGCVTLMTLHSAKGLEFPRVYLVGLEEGLLPHKRSVEGTESEIAEERRLAYVGITRAMDFLSISRAQARTKWGKRSPTIPSRFLLEMCEEDSEDEAAEAPAVNSAE